MQKIIIAVTAVVLVLLSFKPTDQFVLTGKITDENGSPIPYASVLVSQTKSGTSSDANGAFSIRVSVGDVVQFSGVGYATQSIKIKKGMTVLQVQMKSISTMNEAVVVMGYGIKRQTRSLSYSTSVVQGEQLNISPSSNVVYSLAGKASGVQITANGNSPVMLRGSQSIQGNNSVVADFDREGYEAITENDFRKVTDEPLSTFSIDVDAASYSNMRRFLNNGQLPPAGAVRIEELVNYFSYVYPQPTKNDPFSVNTEISECPWNKDHRLALIGLQGKIIPVENLPASNIVFLIDVSGSMDSEDKLPLLKKSLKLLVDQLREKDKVSLCVYAGNAGLVLPATNGMQKQKIKDAIDALDAGGSTAGGAGIQLAYKTAADNFIKEGNNRVILCTDGDFNIGMSSDDELERMIEKERERGVFLTVLGFGTGNYQDAKMQKLADKGNGNHAYIDQLSEAKKVLVSEFGGTLFTIAKDVKLQIEFNPAKVAGYRLIGYENRMLNKEDFNDDKKDAGDMGSGHTVTALYEIIPAGVASAFLKSTDPLKYQKPEKFSNSAQGNEMMTVKLRYKQPDGVTSKLMEVPVLDENKVLATTSDNYRFAASVASFGMLLRNSAYKQQSSFKSVINLSSGAMGIDKEGYRKEFVQLVQKAVTLVKKSDRKKLYQEDDEDESATK